MVIEAALLPSFVRLGPLRLSLYGISSAVGLVAALAVSQPSARRASLPAANVWDALSTIAFAAIVFSRLLLIAANCRGLWAAPLALLASPGINDTGLLLTGLFAAFWIRRTHLPYLAFLDAAIPSATLLWAFLTVGRVIEGTRKGMASSRGGAQPVELYTLLFALWLCLFALRLLPRRRVPGRLTAAALMLCGLTLFFLDFLRLPATLSGPAILDPVQWLGLAMLVIGVGLRLGLPATAASGPFHAF